MEKAWDPHLQGMMDNTSGDTSNSETNHEDGKNQSFSTNFFASKDSQQLPPETGFSFGPSPMRGAQQLSGSRHGQDNSVRGLHDNVKFDRSSGYLMAQSVEPPASTGFTFGPAPRQLAQKMTPPSQNTNVPALFNIPRHDPLPAYLNRPSFEPSQSMQRLPSYPANGNGTSQGRLSLPSFSSHMQADSNSFREGNDSRVLTTADNYFKQQILQDIELKTKPRNSQTYSSTFGTGQIQSPLTQLANNMISQTSMPLQKPVGPSPPGQNIFHTQAISPSDKYAVSSSASQVQSINRNAENSGFSPAQQTSSGNAGQFKNDRQIIAFGNAPPLAHGIQLVSPHELPDRFRQVFPYELFNAVQSKCFAPIYKTSNNIVVSAPTGSGKTALMELAICKLVESHGSGQFKIVYQAPIKSLCSERMKDWTKKFSHLNLPVAELTGDTSNAEMSRVGSASIIITTPEKWDSITRKWTDYQKLLQLVKLFLIDEVHILKDARGATLEAVVSRMHSIGANVRFVALSATVPNSHDIATWLGRDSSSRQLPAHRETFGEEFRPVKLQKHVHGYESRANDFAFEKILDGKIPALIQKYSCKKPIMVFCFTRKSCEGTAAILAEYWTRQRNVDRAWPAPTNRTVVGNKDLQELVGCGVAYHHAGLDSQDRSAIETAYLKGDISVICCTSTLAVGVNLPCQLVVLKGTVCFQDSGLVEYSDLEVMQMLGRAGRPQFDDSATAIIMTRMDNTDRYKKMISGQDVLESTLHLNLIEHLNSEIGLRTIKTAYEAKVWLGGTFLSVRMRQNPNYYKFSGVAPSRDADQQLELVCERDIKLLQDYELVTKEDFFSCTEYGAAMSRYMVQFETMKLLLSIPRHSKTEQILSTVCQAAEFKDLRMKPNERSSLREFNKSPMIKFPIKDNISTTAHKIFLMIQVQLGGIEPLATNDFRIISRQFSMETNIILDRVQRLIRCVIDCKAFDCDSISTRFALDLSRSIAAGFWEHSSLQLRQVPQIGPASLRKLAGNNVNSVEKLAGLDTAGIERVMSKNPPFGKKMKDNLMEFPRLTLTAEILGRAFSKAGAQPKVKVNAVLGYKNDKVPNWLGRIPFLTFIAEISSGTLVYFWRGNIKRLLNGNKQQFTVELSSPDDEIKCWLACDEIVGTLQSCVLNHDIPAVEFPPPKVVVEEQSIMNKSRTEQVATSDEFDDGIDDDAMLAAAKQVEGGRRVSSDYGSDAFIDIDTVDLVNSVNNKRSRDEVDQPEAVKMYNGKWACNHHCRDGNTLKNGQLCKHRCCREGLDKPRKITRKKSTTDSIEDQGSKSSNKIKGAVTKPMNIQSSNSKQLPKLAKKPRLMPSGASGSDQHDVEVIDLSETIPPVIYPDVASKDYQKLHKLHTSIQKDTSVRLPKNQPKFSYANGEMFSLSFMNKGASESEKKDESDPFDSDGYEFPSPSTLLKGDMHKDKSVSIPATQLPPPAMGISRYESKSQQDSAEDSFDDPTGSLEDAMIGLDDSMNLRPATPKLNTSFANNVFDFAAFDSEEAYTQQFSSPLMSQAQKRNTQAEVDDDDLDVVMQSMKRQQSSPWMRDFRNGNMMSHNQGDGDEHSYDDSPALPQMKRRRVDDGDDESGLRSTMKNSEDMKSTSGSSAPAWANEMGSEILDDEENEENKKGEKQKFGIKANIRPEPAWVGEMDQDFINMFRGYVDFMD
ncbi:hypothetical protein SS1G_11638 [Sclerotinia sclerotiorum 1980 UF-70]|uniref:DNA 3'-5' helicase n=2 Tax=Sclerotinia sclerotiorum (strain ATCC 18683 / 1980 / Ss-1) TaxID=665079 RepID=A7F217_SCLS1|nr:hypothetical protein SS1G_11638 [Sclerotinia sclerotiorum 1980 UF-70]APA11383.1 hypothetical protein sscle_07g061530 [Sclerotinia sclerotiorum 1980 UF-70]EDN95759.1 hypothetical protein SS1G_11638 [Sclerotinia sclerotiorum 1980 UF-70]